MNPVDQVKLMLQKSQESPEILSLVQLSQVNQVILKILVRQGNPKTTRILGNLVIAPIALCPKGARSLPKRAVVSALEYELLSSFAGRPSCRFNASSRIQILILFAAKVQCLRQNEWSGASRRGYLTEETTKPNKILRQQ